MFEFSGISDIFTSEGDFYFELRWKASDNLSGNKTCLNNFAEIFIYFE